MSSVARGVEDNVPLHSFWAFVCAGGDSSQLLPQHPNLLYGGPYVAWQIGSNLLPYNAGQLRAVTVGADHNLEWSISVYTAKVEIALWGYIGNIGGYLFLLAELPYAR